MNVIQKMSKSELSAEQILDKILPMYFRSMNPCHRCKAAVKYFCLICQQSLCQRCQQRHNSCDHTHVIEVKTFALLYENTFCQCSVCGKKRDFFCYLFAIHICNACIKCQHPDGVESQFIFSSRVCIAHSVQTFNMYCLECNNPVSRDHKNDANDHRLADLRERYYLKNPMQKFKLPVCSLPDSEPEQILFQPPNKLYMSNSNGLIFIIDFSGNILDRIQINQRHRNCGWSTITKAGELLYIDKYSKTVCKYQGNEEKSSPFVWMLEGTPICICTQNEQNDILILLQIEENANSTLVRFDQHGRQILKASLNWKSTYVTENGNGDICTTSWSDIVGIKVLCNEAKCEKFSYTGREGESNFTPSKICTDSHCEILILNDTGNNIHVINEAGQFLRLILLDFNTQKYGFAFCVDDNGALWTYTHDQIKKYGYLNGKIPWYTYKEKVDSQVYWTNIPTLCSRCGNMAQEYRGKERIYSCSQCNEKYPRGFQEQLTILYYQESDNCSEKCEIHTGRVKVKYCSKCFRHVCKFCMRECDKGNHIYLHRRLQEAKMPQSFLCSVPIKYWELSIPDDGLDLCHITFLPPDKICVSNHSGFIFINNGKQWCKIKTNQHFPLWGFHTATISGNLLWVDTSDNSIKGYQMNSGTITTIMWTGDWRPYCVFSSPVNNDILVGMIKDDESKVVRHDANGTILWESEKGRLFFPLYITENKNGDTCVSDCRRNKAVVVFSKKGSYRFSYTGSNDGSEFMPAGICTDKFSHILINNCKADNVHIIDQNGQFIRILMTKLQLMEHERGICLDSYGNIWVCGNRKAKMYRYLTME